MARPEAGLAQHARSGVAAVSGRRPAFAAVALEAAWRPATSGGARLFAFGLSARATRTQEVRGLAFGAILAAEGRRRSAIGRRSHGAAAGLHHREGITFGTFTLRSITFGPITLGAFAFGTILTIAVGTVIPVAPAIPATAFLALATGPVVTLALFPGPIFPRPIVPGPVVPLPVLPGAIVALPVIAVTEAITPVIAVPPGAAIAGFGVRLSRFGLRALDRFFLEVDVEAGIELVAADDLGGGPGGLHGPDQAEIMLGVLQEVLGQHPVAGGGGVAGQLLVTLEDRLGVAADLDPLWAVGLQGPVRIVLLRLATGAAIATALTLHALEISHVPPFRRPAVNSCGLGLFFWPVRRVPPGADDPK